MWTNFEKKWNQKQIKTHINKSKQVYTYKYQGTVIKTSEK